jgi:hypothetical protein
VYADIVWSFRPRGSADIFISAADRDRLFVWLLSYGRG